MLKVESIEFIDQNQRSYKIEKNQLESFPLTGGTFANVVTTKAWNQHGNTHVESYMESFEGDLTFIIVTEDKLIHEIEEQRKEITNICNPLNGTVKMKVTLNSGAVYNRDITFVAAPTFPIGRENRNNVWQKVLLQYEANNPFWYAEGELIESFKSVESSFEFPFESIGVNDRAVADLSNKVWQSTIENPNEFKYRQATAIGTPADFTANSTQGHINAARTLDGEVSYYPASVVGNIPQMMWSFDTVQTLERKYGAAIWNGETTLAGKVAIAESLITYMLVEYYGYGGIPTGNRINLRIWDTVGLTWYGTVYNTATAPQRIAQGISAVSRYIDANGFQHALVYSEAATAANNAWLRTDYIRLNIDVTFAEPVKELEFGTVLENNKATNIGQVEAPVTIRIEGACVNPRIENVRTGEFLKFNNLTMGAADVLEIDTTFGQKKVTLNGANVFNKLDYASTFFNLQIGENEIDFRDDTGSTAAQIEFIYKSLFITI